MAARKKARRKGSDSRTARRPAARRAASGEVATDVDAYLAALPPGPRAALQKLRARIRAVAPGATEVISYRMPTFRYLGGLVAFAAMPNHLGFYFMSTSVRPRHLAALEGFEVGKGSVRFTQDKPLPAGVVEAIVRDRMAENEALRSR
jgi:uncharacterized protein YdhG (YjbR/CyaY superfamily)